MSDEFLWVWAAIGALAAVWSLYVDGTIPRIIQKLRSRRTRS